MNTIEQQLSESFHRWELRGRGWQISDFPVALEPPFRLFPGHYLYSQAQIDDARKPTVLSSFVERLGKQFGATPALIPSIPDDADEQEPEALFREPLTELEILLPQDFKLPSGAFEEFLSSISICHGPVTFEVIGTPSSITTQFSVDPADAALVPRQLCAFFPDAAPSACFDQPDQVGLWDYRLRLKCRPLPWSSRIPMNSARLIWLRFVNFPKVNFKVTIFPFRGILSLGLF